MIICSLILGGVTGYLIREPVTPLFLSGRTFSGRNLIFQLAILCILWGVLSILFFSLLYGVSKYFKKTVTCNPIVNLSITHRLSLVIVVTCLGILLIFFFNNIFSLINTHSWHFNDNDPPFRYNNPVGIDFRSGIYRPHQMLINKVNIYTIPYSIISPTPIIYPPFTYVFFLPVQLLSENHAYLLMVFLLLCSNIVSLGLIASIFYDLFAVRFGEKKQLFQITLFLVTVMIGFYTLSSYPFLFSIERGNYDSIANLFAVFSIYVLIKKPKSIWLSVILISISVHFKIYPAAIISPGTKSMFATMFFISSNFSYLGLLVSRYSTCGVVIEKK